METNMQLIPRLATFLQWLKSTSSVVALRAAAYDDPNLLAECSTTDRNGGIVRGATLVGFTCLNAALYTCVVAYLAGGFSLPLGIACVSVAALLGLSDHYVFYRAAVYTDGLHALRDGGMQIDFLAPLPRYSKLAKCVRIGLSLIVSTITAIGIGLVLNNSAIDRRIDQEYVLANRAVVDRAVRDFADGLKRKETAYTSKLAEIERVSAGRRDNLRAASREAQAAKRDIVIATHDAAEGFEKRMAPLQARLTALKEELDRSVGTRQESVRRAIEASPDHIPKSTTFTRRIKALFYEEAAENPWTLLPVGLVDLAIVLLDLSVLTLKAIYYPSGYAAAVTRDALSRLVAEARRGTSRRGGDPMAPENGLPDPEPPDPPLPPATAPAQPRRKRGRPRKNGFDVTAFGTPNTSDTES
jgi:Domain of unknown function (DUF4407)